MTPTDSPDGLSHRPITTDVRPVITPFLLKTKQNQKKQKQTNKQKQKTTTTTKRKKERKDR
jgi:hypothetical protein